MPLLAVKPLQSKKLLNKAHSVVLLPLAPIVYVLVLVFKWKDGSFVVVVFSFIGYLVICK